MGDLKPCPFCNCEMEIVPVGRDWWRIKPVDGHEDECPFGELHEWDCSQQKPEWKDEHIADWNKRADDRLVEENAELRGELEIALKQIQELTPLLSIPNKNGNLQDATSAIQCQSRIVSLLTRLNKEGKE